MELDHAYPPFQDRERQQLSFGTQELKQRRRNWRGVMSKLYIDTLDLATMLPVSLKWYKCDVCSYVSAHVLYGNSSHWIYWLWPVSGCVFSDVCQWRAIDRNNMLVTRAVCFEKFLCSLLLQRHCGLEGSLLSTKSHLFKNMPHLNNSESCTNDVYDTSIKHHPAIINNDVNTHRFGLWAMLK